MLTRSSFLGPHRLHAVPRCGRADVARSVVYVPVLQKAAEQWGCRLGADYCGPKDLIFCIRWDWESRIPTERGIFEGDSVGVFGTCC